MNLFKSTVMGTTLVFMTGAAFEAQATAQELVTKTVALTVSYELPRGTESQEFQTTLQLYSRKKGTLDCNLEKELTENVTFSGETTTLQMTEIPLELSFPNQLGDHEPIYNVYVEVTATSKDGKVFHYRPHFSEVGDGSIQRSTQDGSLIVINPTHLSLAAAAL